MRGTSISDALGIKANEIQSPERAQQIVFRPAERATVSPFQGLVLIRARGTQGGANARETRVLLALATVSCPFRADDYDNRMSTQPSSSRGLHSTKIQTH